MRPIKLALTAFGPYAGEQIIDFRELGDRTFFLIHGPTGSGKTTILDAICFAMYGETSGDARTGEQMRSHHTKTSLLTQVTYDFALGRDYYRIHRSPKQERSKERGTGTVNVPPKATLWKINGTDGAEERQVIAATPKETNDQVKALLGFESKQFRQVIMLPQDEFRQLLMADSVEREVIFKSLFQTERFERIEDALREEAKALETDIGQDRDKQNLILQQAHASAESDLVERKATIEQRLTDLQTQLEVLRGEDAHSRELLSSGEEDERKLREHDIAETRLRDLRVRFEAVAVDRQNVELARKAAVLVEAEQALIQQTASAEETEGKYNSAESEYHDALFLQDQAASLQTNEEQRSTQRATLRKQLDELQGYYTQVTALEEAQREFMSVQAKFQAAMARKDEAKSRRDQFEFSIAQVRSTLPELENIVAQINAHRLTEANADKAYGQCRRLAQCYADQTRLGRDYHATEESLGQSEQTLEQLRQAISVLEERVAARPQLNRQVTDLEEAIQQRDQLDEIGQQLGKANRETDETEKLLNQAQKDANRARVGMRQIETRWLKGQASILAQQLSEDGPCPVCGSTHHPRPATAVKDLPNEDAVDEARSRFETLDEHCGDIERKLSSERELVAQLKERQKVTKERLASQKASSFQELNALLESALKSRSLLDQQENQLKAKREQMKGLEIELALIRKVIAGQNETLISLRAEIGLLEQDLGDQKDIPAHELERRLSIARTLRQDAEAKETQLVQLRTELEDAGSKLASAGSELDEAEGTFLVASSQRTEAEAVLTERGRGIPVELRDSKYLDRRVRQVDVTLQALQNALEAAQHQAAQAKELVAATNAKRQELAKTAISTRRTADEQGQLFKQRVLEVGFENDEAYRVAKMTQPQIAELEQKIRDFDGEFRSAQDRVERAKQIAQSLTRPDLIGLRRASENARRIVDEAVAQIATLSERLKETVYSLEEFQKVGVKLQEKEQQYRVIGRVSEVANGKNNHKINFHRFVLAAKMEEVLWNASRRLLTMSRGRYLLKRSESPSSRQRASGLELDVSDTWTGDTTRTVKTLSGGESFQASLALALGLADVVQTYAGGIRLDTIFIDEGFGSLDSESLELAIQTLYDLGQGRRLVGIISHVDSLKERISTRLEVTSGTQGSHARFVMN